MAQAQIDALDETNVHSFECVDITVNSSMNICIERNCIKIRQKDEFGRNKSCVLSRENWFELIGFTQIINSFFLMTYHKNCHDSLDNSNQTYNDKQNMLDFGKKRHKSGTTNLEKR